MPPYTLTSVGGKADNLSQWVRRTLTPEGIVVKKHLPKSNFLERDFAHVRLTLWTQGDLIYIHERYRVQTSFIINVYCWTGARLDAFFKGGLRYQNRCEFSVVLVKMGTWEEREKTYGSHEEGGRRFN